MYKKKLLVLVGPTAVGKTAVAIALAEHYKTVIISADSRQVFKEMNIGTAKPSEAELAAVQHYFVNTRSIHEPYDAAEYGRDALALIQQLFEKHDKLILCGGSGLYVKAVCEGFDDIPDVDPAIRGRLMKELEHQGIGKLQEQLRLLDPEFFQTIDKANPHRLIRALEVRIGTGMSIAAFRKKKKLEHTFDIIKIGLERSRTALYETIDSRMDKMIADGLFEEASSLYPHRNYNALQTVGYQEIFDWMDGKYDRNEAIRLLKRNTRRYAKRQLTWFKRDPEIVWVNPVNIEKILSIAEGGENEVTRA